jgi:hypothetical protein
MMVNVDWHFDPESKEARKLDEMITAQAKRLKKAVTEAVNDDEKYAAVFNYYRKYYTLTLNKTCLEAGINRSPTRDIILDYPWKELNLHRFTCLKLWEKINH